MKNYEPEIIKPVCIMGTGRSGTTLLLRLLSCHPELGWFSNFNSRYPKWQFLALWSRILDLPWIGDGLPYKWRITPKASEAVSIPRYLTNGVFTQPRVLDKQDATVETMNRYRKYVKSNLRYQNKKRFVQKHTGFPRMSYLSTIFPDALFIHVLRDGRAVANSMANVSWWDGTMKSWWWGPMKPEYEEEYLKADKEPIVLASIVWKTLMDFMYDAKKQVARDQYFEVRYDNLVSDLTTTMSRTLQYCELDEIDCFYQRILSIPVINADVKWKSDLTSREIKLVEDCLSNHLEKYGFHA